MKTILLFIVLMFSQFATLKQVHAQMMTFIHPGALESQAELDFVKKQIQKGNEPWASKFNQVKEIAMLGEITIPNDDKEQKEQARKAYANALTYQYTGNEFYADQAIEILKKFSSLAPYNVAADQSMLLCAWIGAILGPAAELVRGYMSDADRVTVTDMFDKVFVPSLSVMSTWNGNVDLTQISALFSISVFCEDTALFGLAEKRYDYRLPGSVYLLSDGPNPVTIEGAGWQQYTQTLFVKDGIEQETCRDFGHHAQFAMSAMFEAAEVAWHQGVDLYAKYKDRLVSCMELLSLQLNTANIQGVCACGTPSQTQVYNTFEIGYNHYHTRMGLDLPQTYQNIHARIRPYGVSDWNIFFETLTHAELNIDER